MREEESALCHCSIQKKKIDELKIGEELEVLTDDVTSRNAIPQWNQGT